jgi:hypothetical protein
MHYYYGNKYYSMWKFFLLGSFLLMAVGCNSLLPEKFQDKTYVSSKVDEQACSLLATPDSLVDSIAYVVHAKTLQSILVDTSWLDSSDNKIIFSKFNELTDSLPTLVMDQLMKIEYPADKKIIYALLKIATGGKGDLDLYTSLNYYYDNDTHTSNINEYVTIELVKQDTTIVSSTVDMQGETFSECTDEVLIASNLRVVPIIRSRDKVHVTEGEYLVRFILSDAQNIAAFISGKRIRDYYFKMTIM